MLTLVLTAVGLVVLTVAIHAVGFSVLMRVIVRWHALAKSGFCLVTGMLISLTCWLILVHLAEIAIWGLYYFWLGCFPDVESAVYFSACTYTTANCELSLSMRFRVLAPLEGLTGILMCGLSTGLFFAVVSRWIGNWMQKATASESHLVTPSNK